MEASQAQPTGGTPPAKPAAAAQPTPAAASSPPAASSRQDDAERYGLEGWRERIRRFSPTLSTHALAGALHGLGEDERLTELEVKERLEAFLAREGVKREDGE